MLQYKMEKKPKANKNVFLIGMKSCISFFKNSPFLFCGGMEIVMKSLAWMLFHVPKWMEEPLFKESGMQGMLYYRKGSEGFKLIEENMCLTSSYPSHCCQTSIARVVHLLCSPRQRNSNSYCQHLLCNPIFFCCCSSGCSVCIRDASFNRFKWCD